MDEFKEERAALKHGTLKEKLSYFFEYYKGHVVVAILVVAAVVSLVHHFATRRDTAFYIALLNSADTTSEELADRSFVEYSGIDPDHSEIIYDTSMLIEFNSMNKESYSSAEKFILLLTTSQLDAVVADPGVIRSYSHNKVFYDLSDFLTAEQIAKYEPYFYYVDYAVIDAVNAAQDAHDTEFVPQYPDPRRPETMEQPVPVGIYVTDCSALTDRFRFYSSDPELVLSVTMKTTRPEITSKYIDYLMADQ